MSTAQRGFIMIALAFPIYLLWKGRLPAYFALLKNNPIAGAGTIAPGTPLVYPGVPQAPLFYSPVTTATPPVA